MGPLSAYSPNPASTVTSSQLLSGQSANVVLTQRRNMDLHRPVSSANNNAPLTVRRRAGERYEPYKHKVLFGSDCFTARLVNYCLQLSHRWMGSCCVGSVPCRTAVSCRRPRSRERDLFPPTLHPSMRKTTTPDLTIIITTTNTDTAALTTSI